MATKINTSDLKVGMFVADLDRPWVDTPFLLQGFVIEDADQIATLKVHCEFVIVDRARSLGDQFEAPAGVSVAAKLAPTKPQPAPPAKAGNAREAPVAVPPPPPPPPAKH